MDGITKIIDRIAAEASEEVARIEAEGAARAAELAAEFAETEKTLYGERIAEGAAESVAQFERLKNVAALEAKKTILAEKQALITEVFEQAVKDLLALPEEQYVALLARVSAEAARTGDEKLVFNATDKARVGAKVVAATNALLSEQGRAAALTLADETRNLVGGVIISGGSIEVNASLTALVEQHRNELAPSVAAILFE